MSKSPRHTCYTKLAIGKSQLGWDDDLYRDFLQQHGAKEVDGRISAKSMDIHQLHAAIDAMAKLGFKVKRPSQISDWRKPRIAKIKAIWLALHVAKVVDNPSDIAMQKWCASVTQKAKLEWATSEDLNNCIEGLKKWAAREYVKLNG